MGQIIVSVQDGNGGPIRDLEIPDDVKIKDLLDDIIQTLNGCDQMERPSASEAELYDRRMKKTLYRGGSTESEGVWNGDILVLRRSRASSQSAGYEYSPRKWV